MRHAVRLAAALAILGLAAPALPCSECHEHEKATTASADKTKASSKKAKAAAKKAAAQPKPVTASN